MSQSGNVYQFIDLPRNDPPKKSLSIRKTEFVEIYQSFTDAQAQAQADRCMACGNPYCQHQCPLHNHIPNWLYLAVEGRIVEAAQMAHRTNSLPEVCGRVCPQDKLCEGSCSLKAEFGAVTIGAVEKYITEAAFDQGWRPQVTVEKIGKKVAVVGSGPAGLACADVLIRHGVEVTVFERDSEIGGLLTFGIPSFKLEKSVMIRRRQMMESMGVQFKLNCVVGKDISLKSLENNFDAVFLGIGAQKGLAAGIENESAQGVYSALPYLSASTQKLLGLNAVCDADVSGKRVIVLGGGDTAMDCVRTALRCAAASVTCVYRRDEHNMPASPKEVQNAREEGGQFCFNAQPVSVMTDSAGSVCGLKVVKTRLTDTDNGARRSVEIVPDSEEILDCDIVLVAFGFMPEDNLYLNECGINLQPKGLIQTVASGGQTSNAKIYAGGDITRGSDLVVHAIAEGRAAAEAIFARWDV